MGVSLRLFGWLDLLGGRDLHPVALLGGLAGGPEHTGDVRPRVAPGAASEAPPPRQRWPRPARSAGPRARSGPRRRRRRPGVLLPAGCKLRRRRTPGSRRLPAGGERSWVAPSGIGLGGGPQGSACHGWVLSEGAGAGRGL